MTIIQPSQKSIDWNFVGLWKQLPKHPNPNPSGLGWWFDFPVVPDPFTYIQYLPNRPPSIGYLVTKYSKPLPPGGSLSIDFNLTVSEGTVFNTQMEESNTGVWPASVVVYFSDHNDAGDEYDRWWSYWSDTTSIILGPGDYNLIVPLVHSNFTSVFGQDSIQASIDRFAKALSHPTDIGMTFGGGFFKGHGINVMDGSARFTLNSYKINL